MNSVAFYLFGLPIHWYGILIALGIVCAVILACFNAKFRGLKKDDIFELLLWLLPPAIIGARLYYLIFNNGPWGWESFAIWSGGLAVYGAILGGAVGAVLYCYFRKKNFFAVADIAVPSVILGQAIGRIGCYFSGCCYGVETTNPSLQVFPISVIINGEWHLATFFYESALCFIACIVLTVLLRKVNIKGVSFCGYMILYGIIRAIMEGLRDDDAALFIGSMKVSQLLSIILIIEGAALLAYLIYAHIKKSQFVVVKSETSQSSTQQIENEIDLKISEKQNNQEKEIENKQEKNTKEVKANDIELQNKTELKNYSEIQEKDTQSEEKDEPKIDENKTEVNKFENILIENENSITENNSNSESTIIEVADGVKAKNKKNTKK